jgi:hypothetical protein
MLGTRLLVCSLSVSLFCACFAPFAVLRLLVVALYTWTLPLPLLRWALAQGAKSKVHIQVPASTVQHCRRLVDCLVDWL